MSKRRNTKRKPKKGPSRSTRPQAMATRSTGIDREQVMGLLRRASTHHAAGRHAQARQLYEQVLQYEPQNAHALFGLGQCIGRLGSVDRGIELTRQAIALDPRQSQFFVSLADLLFSAVRCEESMEAARRALALDSRNLSAMCVLANNHERFQQFDEAIDMLRKAEAISSDDPYVQVLLSRMERRSRRHEEAATRLERFLKRTNIGDEYRRRALFEYASTLDRVGRFDEAFEAITDYGRMTLATPTAKRFNREARPARIAGYQAAVTPERMARWTNDWHQGKPPAPTFLVGFPRSGTTMTEQVLAAHPGIMTSDERPYVSAMRSAWVRMVGASDDVGGMFDRLTIDGARELRDVYWNAAERELGEVPSEKVLVDKLPLNLIDIGLINAVFPDARVIVALRDPRDVCISCLMQDFALNNAVVHFLTLDDTTAFYEKVMGFYLSVRDALTLTRIEIRYEDTVSDLEGQARRILELLGVEWVDDITRFHEKARGKVISTPSFEAVTQPVHRGAIGRWHNYEKHFQPFLHRLEPFVDAFGYDGID